MKEEKAKKLEQRGVVLAKFHEVPKKRGKPGRPGKTLKDLPRNWRSIIRNEMGEGASLEEIKAKFKLYNKTYRRFLVDFPEFKEVIEEGKELSKAWWMKTGRLQLWNKNFSYTGWYMQMKNRFGWTDRQEQTHVLDVPSRITIQKADRVIELKPPQKELMPGDLDNER
jgi:hypothetical protein